MLHAMDWLAFGDLRGFLVPCGCDPHTDMGGVKRLGTLLARERFVHPEMLIFHLGNAFSLQSKEARKNLYIRKALEAFRPTASLFNEGELLHPELVAAIPYVLSNGKKPGVFQTVLRLGPYEIWGFVWKDTLSGQLETWESFFQAHERELKIPPVGISRILLFSGPSDVLKKANAISWTLILSSNTQSYDIPINEAEKQDPTRLVRQENPLVRMVPLGGQGVLRGGRLVEREAPSLSALLISTATGATSLSFSEAVPITWLEPRFEAGSPLGDLFAAYEKEEAEAFTLAQAAKKADMATSLYAGAEACKTCHATAYATWKNSHHAKAHDTLKAQNKHQIRECVGCHTVGHFEKGGFVSETVTPHLAGVQCENCHGPRKAHAQNPTIKGGPAATCSSCHVTPHSPRFSKEEYWKKISHGKD